MVHVNTLNRCHVEGNIGTKNLLFVHARKNLILLIKKIWYYYCKKKIVGFHIQRSKMLQSLQKQSQEILIWSEFSSNWNIIIQSLLRFYNWFFSILSLILSLYPCFVLFFLFIIIGISVSLKYKLSLFSVSLVNFHCLVNDLFNIFVS